MKPIAKTTPYFQQDRHEYFQLMAWDTPSAALENAVSTDGLQLRVKQPATTLDEWNAWVATLKAVAEDVTAEAAFTSTVGATATVEDGRVQTLQQFWGAGAPNWWGVSQTGRAAVCFQGSLVDADRRQWFETTYTGATTTVRITPAFAGNGWLRLDLVSGSTVTTIFKGDVSETLYLEQGLLTNGYFDVAEGTTLRVYYVQSGVESWGGLVVKAVRGQLTGTAEEQAIQLAEAPVVSGSLFAYGDEVVGTQLQFISDVDVTHDLNTASRMSVRIPLINPASNDGSGWIYERPSVDHPGQLVLMVAGEEVFTLKRKRLIQLTHHVTDPTGGPVLSTDVFTGHVNDFAEQSNGTAVIDCISIEGRLVEQYDQLPDRISYMTYNFRVLDFGRVEPEQRAQPVYNVPAFDNWPLEYALREIGTRAGVDSSVYYTPRTVVQAGAVVNADPLVPLFAARVLAGNKLRLPRPTNYGNVGLGFTENRPLDDAYVFPVEPTRDLWATARELLDKVGYRHRFDESGRAQLYGANIPDKVVDFVAASFVTPGTLVTHAGAYGAGYAQTTATTNSITTDVYAARIDVSFPRAVGLRSWNYTVTRISDSVLVASGSISTADASLGDLVQTLFDAPLVNPESNSTVATLYTGGYDEYTVVLTPNAVAGTAAVDCLLLYTADTLTPVLPILSTDATAISVATEQQQDAVRNKITVVGRRKASVTDSEKFAEAQQPTEQEFIAQNAVDVGSITDPTASNYIGYQKHGVIYDSAIADDNFARYLAQAFIFRQRYPRPGATVEHALLPFVQIGDPIYVHEAQFKTVTSSHPVYVTKVNHKFAVGKALTTITAEPWPDYPAYMPRLDIDLAGFNNEPVTNINITYTSLSGHAVSNATLDDVVEASDQAMLNVTSPITVTAGSPPYLQLLSNAPWPPLPGTVQIKNVDSSTAASGPYSSTQTYTGYPFTPVSGALIATFHFEPFAFFLGAWVKIVDSVSGSAVNVGLGADSNSVFYMTSHSTLAGTTIFVYKGNVPYEGTTNNITLSIVFESFMDPNPVIGGDYIANGPYRHLIEPDYRDGQKRVYLPWNQGDGSSRYARGSDHDTFVVRYRALGPTDGSGTLDDPYPLGPDSEPYSPFYDPYTSELGNLVKTEMDVLADGLYRISVRSVLDDTVVAWLTAADADPKDENKHWEFFTVGSKRVLYWDGVDQLGTWNAQQSELYSTLNYGVFETDTPPRIGGGFYAWNMETARGRLGPMAFIWMKRDSNTGKPLIGQGTYSAWYVHVEARTDVIDATVTTKTTKTVFTHLPEPTKVELKVQQYDGAEWDDADYTTIASDSTLHGTIRNARPIRLRFKVADRPGVLWDGNTAEVSVKLTREVHLRAIIGDQSILYKGSSYPGTLVEERVVVNRRLTNDTHTNRYTDNGYRKAGTLKWTDEDTGVTEWEFAPQDFKRAFRFTGIDEAIEFGNYLQLEEVPGWNQSRETAAVRSRLQFALMSYLFYLSAFVTDRSGRSFWAMNRTFLDKSKITDNTHAYWWNPDAPTTAANSTTYRLAWPDDPMYQQRRTMVCRQWTGEYEGETTWVEAQRVLHGFSAGSLATELFQHFWWQHEYDATTVGVGVQTWANFGLTADLYSGNHTANTNAKLPAAFDTIEKQLGVYSGGSPLSALNATTSGWGTPPAGGWQFEENPSWIPSITRDLHPYHMVPSMMVPAKLSGGANPVVGNEADRRKINIYTTVDGRDYTEDKNEGADVAAAEVWSSPVYAMDAAVSSASWRRFWPGYRVDRESAPIKNRGLIDGTMDYIRQDETVHWEDLRGLYSRSARPAEAPVKVAAGLPYYINQGLYDFVEARAARKNPAYPKFGANITKWFRLAFRHEYLWESGTMFPCTIEGKERPDMHLWWRTRFQGTDVANLVVYDHGAWVGWKDDHASGYTGAVWPTVTGIRAWRAGEGWSNEDGIGRLGSPLEWGFMPVGVGPVMPTTAQLTAHLVLVTERRGGV